MSTYKVFDGTNWVDPCNCNIHLLDSGENWVLLDPKNCPTKYWNGCEWVLITCPCICPPNYVFNPESGVCENALLLPATYTDDIYYVVTGSKIGSYGSLGARMYEDITTKTFPINGYSASGSYILKENAGSGSVIGITATSINTIFQALSPTTGRLNISSIWASATPSISFADRWPDYYWLKFQYCITIDVEKQYVIGIAGDNAIRIKIDSASFGTDVELVTLYPSYNSNPTFDDGIMPVDGTSIVTETFNYWHMFPITLPAGTHTIHLEGYNLNGDRSIGAEIYDLTKDELVSQFFPNGASQALFEDKIIFSTKNLAVGPIPTQLTVAAPDTSGTWSCPEGGEFSDCYGVPACVQIVSEDCQY